MTRGLQSTLRVGRFRRQKAQPVHNSEAQRNVMCLGCDEEEIKCSQFLTRITSQVPRNTHLHSDSIVLCKMSPGREGLPWAYQTLWLLGTCPLPSLYTYGFSWTLERSHSGHPGLESRVASMDSLPQNLYVTCGIQSRETRHVNLSIARNHEPRNNCSWYCGRSGSSH